MKTSRLTALAALSAISAFPFLSGPSRGGQADPGGAEIRRARRGTRRTSGTPEQNAARIAKAVAKRERKARLRLERAA